MPGIVYIVGAGPGDPELITAWGERVLRSADVVLYDALLDDALLELVPPHCERVYVGKRARAHTMHQDEINQLLVNHARAGRVVVRLKGGDPYVYGRGGDEGAALARAGVEFQVIPGVSSAFAVAASAGIPVTQRGLAGTVVVVHGRMKPGAAPPAGGDPGTPGDQETVVDLSAGRPGDAPRFRGPIRLRRRLASASDPSNTEMRAGARRGLARPETDTLAEEPILPEPLGEGELTADWAAVCQCADTLVIMMGVEIIDEIAACLLEHGRPPDEPVAVVQHGCSARQKTLVSTVGSLAEDARAQGLETPGLIVVGDVVAYRQVLDRWETRPLFGRRVAVLTPAVAAAPVVRACKEAGALVLGRPVLRVDPARDFHERVEELLAECAAATHVLFTSAPGAESLFMALEEAGRDLRALPPFASLVASGRAAAEVLRARGLRVFQTTNPMTAAEYQELFGQKSRSARVLVVDCVEARGGLRERLLKDGAVVVDASPYRYRVNFDTADDLRRGIEAGEVDAVVVSSGPEVTALESAWGDGGVARTLCHTCVCATNQRAGRKLASVGLRPDAIARSEAPEVVARALRRALQKG